MNPIKELLEREREKGRTIENIARNVGVHTSSVAQWRSGKSVPTLAVFSNLCYFLKLSSHEIVGILNDIALMHNSKTKVIRTIFSDSEKEEVLILLENGFSIPTIVEQTNVRPATIHKWKAEEKEKEKHKERNKKNKIKGHNKL